MIRDFQALGTAIYQKYERRSKVANTLAVFQYIHWTIRFKSTLDAFTKVESTRKRPMDLLPIDLYSG